MKSLRQDTDQTRITGLRRDVEALKRRITPAVPPIPSFQYSMSADLLVDAAIEADFFHVDVAQTTVPFDTVDHEFGDLSFIQAGGSVGLIESSTGALDQWLIVAQVNWTHAADADGPTDPGTGDSYSGTTGDLITTMYRSSFIGARETYLVPHRLNIWDTVPGGTEAGESTARKVGHNMSMPFVMNNGFDPTIYVGVYQDTGVPWHIEGPPSACYIAGWLLGTATA